VNFMLSWVRVQVKVGFEVGVGIRRLRC